MNIEVARREMRTLAFLSPERQERVFKFSSVNDMLKIDVQFEHWAHKNQLPPDGDGWRTWLLQAGRGFGKTRAGAEWVHGLALARRGVRIALVGANIGDARSVMVDGASGLLAVARARESRVKWEPSQGLIRWPNGSEAKLFSGDNPDGLRGPEHDFAWCDELAKWRDGDEAWDNLVFGMRRGIRPRTLVTTTPRSIPLLKRIAALPTTVTTRGRTSDNINLDEKVVELMIATYAGTRLGRQELDGELIEDIEGSLWPRALIDKARVEPLERAMLGRVVVGVDPPVSTGAKADACGIVVAGAMGDKLYVLEDASVQGLSPEGWANRVAAAAARWDANLVVAETNNGGDLVTSVLKAADVPVKVRTVHASRGKCARAEPVALKFEAGKAFFAGAFPELEDELSGMMAGGDYVGRSPDRADAMVWAMTALGESRSGVPRVARL